MLVLPFAATPTPALLDYPNHLARVHVLLHWTGNPAYQQVYQPHWTALPNLAFDMIGMALGAVLPIYLAGQVVLVAAVLLNATGLLAVSAALHGRPRPFCLVGLLFVFSQPFAYGFVGLILGFGLALWGVALWLRLRAGPPWRLLAVSCGVAILLFFAHLFALGAYAAATFGIEAAVVLRRPVRDAAGQFRRIAAWVPQCVAPAAVMLFASPTPLDTATTRFGGVLRRLYALPLAPVRTYDDATDVATAALLAGLIAAGLWTRRLRVAPAMRPALAILAVLSVLMPTQLAGSDSVEIRLPVITMLLFAASADWRAGPRALAAGALALVTLMTVRTAETLVAFGQADRFIADLRTALAPLPDGARVASITVTTAEDYRIRPEWPHAICYDIIDKSFFVPTLFMQPRAQPLLRAEALRTKAFPYGHFVSRPGTTLSASRFPNLDYVVMVNPGLLHEPLPSNLARITAGPGFDIYRVLREP